MIKNQKIIIGDCRKKLKEIKKESVSLVVTSPPYNIGKKYGKYKDNISLEEWKKLITEVFELVNKCLKKNGSFFLNVSPVPDKKTKEIIPLDAICYYLGKESGFFLRNSIVWHFNNMQNCNRRLSGRWEKILWFVKDINNYIFNLDSIRIPYITKNDKRLDPDGGRNPTDVWYFDRVNNMTKNKLNIADIPTIYPKRMIERILKMSSKKGDTILDPFVGSGTSLIVAEILDRKGIGIDIDPKYEKIIKKRLKSETKVQMDLL
jgi:adenine-specific DNA-methyltransferase